MDQSKSRDTLIFDVAHCSEVDKITSWSDEKWWLTKRYSKYEITLTKINKQGQNCIFIDDKIENVEAATQLGILGFHLDRKSGMTLRYFENSLKCMIV